MKRLLLLIVFLSVKFCVVSQTFFPDSSTNYCLKLSTDYLFASNAMTNNFAKAYLQNEFIDDDKKNNISENLSNRNHFGAELNTEIFFSQRSDSLFGLKNSFFSFSIGNHYHIDSKFRTDVFEIYFRGNKNYAGKTAELSDFIYNQIFYQQVNFSAGHLFKKNENTFGWMAGASLNKGQKFFRIEAPRGSLFTESSGEWLNLDANVTVRQSDSSTSDLSTWSGSGASGNLAFFWTDKHNQTLSLTAKNFGYISWNKQSSYVHADTSFQFNGIDVSELFNFRDSVKENILIDSSFVQPYIKDRQKKTFTELLPADLSLAFHSSLIPQKLEIDLSVSYLFFSSSVVAERIGLQYNFNDNNHIRAIIRHGGYSLVEGGLEYELRFAKQWLINLGSDYLTGILDKKHGTSQGAFASLSVLF